MRETTPLTTTSYAVLGLLALRPWGAYALAKQMERSLRVIWPRAESRIYDEPRKLVAHGLAVAEQAPDGRRRTEYAITDTGRDALRAWLAEPGGLPTLEFEGLLKVLYAEHGDLVSLRATLRRVEQQARDRLAIGDALAAEYLAGTAPFPERIHINALAWEYLRRHHQTVAEWAAWATGMTAGWSDTEPDPNKTAAARATFEDVPCDVQ